MNDARRVGFLQGPGYLNGNVQDLGKIYWPAAQMFPQRDTVDEFGGDEVPAVFVAHLINGDDVRMIERRSSVSLLTETAETIAILGECFCQNLDGNLSPQARVFSQIHLTHSALANLRADFVTTKFCTWR